MCHWCTYQNWPRAPRCAMCSHKRLPPAEAGAGGGGAEAARGATRRESPSLEASTNKNEADRRRLQADWPWLDACMGVVQGDVNPVEAYLSSGGDPTRQLTATEVAILNRPSAFDVGHTLVHLAIR
jgi:ubiquitin thioesterase ZRANB1